MREGLFVKTIEVFGTATALSSLVHGEIMAENYEKGNTTTFRRESMIGRFETDRDWKESVLNVPVISGNAVRGVGRRLLFDHTFAVLDVQIGELFSSPKIARQVQNSLRAGGVISKGTSVEDVAPDQYFRLLNEVAFIDMLGMVFQGHHFEGAAKIGGLVPYINEIKHLYQYSFSEEYCQQIANRSIDFESLCNGMKTTRYMKKKEIGGIAEDGDVEKDKEAMIYGIEYLPAGTVLATDGRITSKNDCTILAFLSLYALLIEKSIIGGMSSKGHGFVHFELFYRENEEVKAFDTAEILKQYDTYLLNSKEQMITNVKNLPEIFTVKKKG